MHGGGPYMVKAVARRLNGGGPCMVVVHMVVVKNIPEWKNCSKVEKMTQEGQNVTSGENFAAWTTCHIVESVSHMDELSHSEQSSLLCKWDHCMFTPP